MTSEYPAPSISRTSRASISRRSRAASKRRAVTPVGRSAEILIGAPPAPQYSFGPKRKPPSGPEGGDSSWAYLVPRPGPCRDSDVPALGHGMMRMAPPAPREGGGGWVGGEGRDAHGRFR